MKIIQIIATENNRTWQGAIIGLGDDGCLYELKHDFSGWFKLADSTIVER